jgi:hypothetical protein
VLAVLVRRVRLYQPRRRRRALGTAAALAAGWGGDPPGRVPWDARLRLFAIGARSPTDRRGPWVYVTSLRSRGPQALAHTYRERWRAEQAIEELLNGMDLDHLVSCRLQPNRIAIGFRLLARNLAMASRSPMPTPDPPPSASRPPAAPPRSTPSVPSPSTAPPSCSPTSGHLLVTLDRPHRPPRRLTPNCAIYASMHGAISWLLDEI